jgi:hypothetical protein
VTAPDIAQNSFCPRATAGLAERGKERSLRPGIMITIQAFAFLT